MRVKFVLTMSNLVLLSHKGKEIKIDELTISWIKENITEEQVQQLSIKWLFNENPLKEQFLDLVTVKPSTLKLIPMDN